MISIGTAWIHADLNTDMHSLLTMTGNNMIPGHPCAHQVASVPGLEFPGIR
jgi:hypothetical protein